jgi:hypothetical protein
LPKCSIVHLIKVACKKPSCPKHCTVVCTLPDFQIFLCITEKAVGGDRDGGRLDGDVPETAFDWLGLKDSFCYSPAAELGYSATSQPLWLSLYCVV